MFMWLFKFACAVSAFAAAVAVASRTCRSEEGTGLLMSYVLGVCGGLLVWRMTARKRTKPWEPPKEYTHEDYRRDLDGLDGLQSIDDLLEKWRETPAPPRLKKVAAEEVMWTPRSLKTAVAQRMAPGTRVVDPTAGPGIFMGAAAAAAVGASMPPRRFVLRPPKSEIKPDRWMRDVRCQELVRILRRADEPLVGWWIEDRPGGETFIAPSRLMPAVPKVGEWWVMNHCPEHGPMSAGLVELKIDESIHRHFMAERARCGCAVPHNFGRGPDSEPSQRP